MLRLIGIVFRYELLRHGSRRAYLLMTLGLPLMASMLIGAYALIATATEPDSQNEQPDTVTLADTAEEALADFKDYRPVAYVDLSGFVQAPDTPLDEKIIFYATDNEAREALLAGDIAAYFIISEDYLETGGVDLIFESFRLEIGEHISLFRFFLRRQFLDSTENSALFQRLENPLTLIQHRIDLERSSEGNIVIAESTAGGDDLTEFWLAYLFAFMLFLSTITASGYLMMSVIEERENGIIEILVSSVRPWPLLTGKIGALGWLGLIQIGTWLGSASLLIAIFSAESFDLQGFEITGYQIMIALIYFVLGYLMLGAIYAGIGAMVGNLREGSQLVTFVVLPVVVPMVILVFLIDNPHAPLSIALSLFPPTAPLTMVIRATVIDIPLLELTLSLFLLVATVGVCIWFAGRLFRLGIILPGSRLPLRQWPRYLFESN